MSETPQPQKKSGLATRIVSSALMLPPMVAAIWFGGPLYAVLIVGLAAVLVWEWHGLLAPDLKALSAIAMCGTAALVAAVGWNDLFAFGFFVLGAVVAAMAARKRQGLDLALLGFGPIYVGLPAVALMMLRARFGFDVTLWVFVLVWATDIGAYAFGRSIGGPKLMPRVSPNKTWAGLLGGMICAATVGGVGVFLADLASASWMVLAVLGAGLAVIAQVGDLFESAIKRRVGAKDSSRLIPGHGGLLDRVDGVLTAAPAAFAVLMSLRAMGALV